MPRDPALERIVTGPIVAVERGRWGFTNRTDLVTLAGGDRLVVQRYRRQDDAAYRLRVMEALRARAEAAGIAIPRVRDADLGAEPPWVTYEVLPGIPVLDAGEASVDGPRFPAVARSMGQLLRTLRDLSPAGLGLRDLWADTARVADRAAAWLRDAPSLAPTELDRAHDVLRSVPDLFSGRPAIVAHGDFVPVNMLTDGVSVTGLLDFESARLADPLFDVAWWAWAVQMHDPSLSGAAWPAFLDGAGVDATEPLFETRIRALQVLRMLELLAAEAPSADVREVVADRLRAVLRSREA